MKRNLLSIYNRIVLFGIFYFRDLRRFKRQRKGDISFRSGKLYPCLGERFNQSGTAKGHYFHQDLLVSRRIFINEPKLHIDVGSRIDGFVAHVASFRNIEVFDIRSLTSNIPNIKFIRADLMETIGEDLIN